MVPGGTGYGPPGTMEQELARYGHHGKLVTVDGVVLVGVAAPVSLTTCSMTPTFS